MDMVLETGVTINLPVLAACFSRTILLASFEICDFRYFPPALVADDFPPLGGNALDRLTTGVRIVKYCVARNDVCSPMWGSRSSDSSSSEESGSL